MSDAAPAPAERGAALLTAPPAAGTDADPGRAPGGDADAHRRRRRSGRDRLVDIGCLVLAVLVGAMFFGESVERTTDALAAADFAAGCLACLALWWRRRWPFGLALAMAVPAVFSDMATAAVLIALFTVAVHRPRREVAVVAAVHVLASMLYTVVRPDPEVPVLLGTIGAALLLAALLASGLYVQARRQLFESLRERVRWVETEQRLLVEQARHLERTRIAREMHDVLAHRISLLSLHAGALEFRPDAPPADVARAAGVIRDSAHQVLEDLREVIGVLRAGPEGAPGQRPQPTLADLPALVEESRGAGARVGTDYRLHDLAAVPTGTGRTAYRIVQEGLTNARKHAPGARVRVVVDGGVGPGLRVEVRSAWPVGAARESAAAAAQAHLTPATGAIPGGGTGLVGLAERAALAGGRLEHGQDRDGNFVLRAWLPWPA